MRSEALSQTRTAVPLASTWISDWNQFQKGASGEWEGITATFNAQGEALELPEHYVPSAYREWEVHLFDWQSLCSMQVLGQEGLRYSLKRMMPTVGCEADAVAFTEEAQTGLNAAEASGSGGSEWPALAPWTADGSYVLAPAEITADQAKLRLESCLMKPRAGPLDTQTRTRVVHNLKRQRDSGDWLLDTVEVHQERFLAPYNGGAELAGCGGGMSLFAQKPRQPAEKLAEAARRAGDGCGAVRLVRQSGGGFERITGSLSIERLLSEASKEGLVLPSNVVTFMSSKLAADGMPNWELRTAVLHESGKGEFESVSATVVSYVDGVLQDVCLGSQSLGH